MNPFEKGDKAKIISTKYTQGLFDGFSKFDKCIGNEITIVAVSEHNNYNFPFNILGSDGIYWDTRDLVLTEPVPSLASTEMKLQMRIQELEEELERAKSTVTTPSFKNGDWVICKSKASDSRFALVLFSNGKGYTAGFNYNGDWSDSIQPYFEYSGYEPRLATSEEVGTTLRREWARRCKEKGWDTPDEAKIESSADGNGRPHLNTGTFAPTYWLPSDKLWTSMGDVYEKGKWATPLFNEQPIEKYVYFDGDDISHTTSYPDEYAIDQPCVVLSGNSTQVDILIEHLQFYILRK